MYYWKTVEYRSEAPSDWRDAIVEVATLADFEDDLQNHGIDPAALTLDDLSKLRDRFVDACAFTESVQVAVEVFAEEYLR